MTHDSIPPPRNSPALTRPDWFTVGRWWSEMPSAGPGLKRRIIGALLELRGLLRPPKEGRICLVHTGRTGSTVLANMLRAHPELYWDDETLGRRTRWFLNQNPDAYLGPRPAQSPVGEIARRFWRARGTRFGFEVKPMHLMAFGLTDLTATDRFFSRLWVTNRIGLVRRNLLRRLISSERFVDQGLAHMKTTSSSETRKPFELSLDAMHSYAGKPLTLEEALREAQAAAEVVPRLCGPDTLQLVYEDDIQDDPRVAYRKVVDHLGLTSTDPEVSLRRTNVGSLDDIVANAEAIRARLRGTEWAWMCEA